MHNVEIRMYVEHILVEIKRLKSFSIKISLSLLFGHFPSPTLLHPPTRPDFILPPGDASDMVAPQLYIQAGSAPAQDDQGPRLGPHFHAGPKIKKKHIYKCKYIIFICVNPRSD